MADDVNFDNAYSLIKGMTERSQMAVGFFVDVVKATHAIVDYNWKDEMRNFEETFEVEIQSQDDIHDWLLWCQDQSLLGNHQPINHIFYSLMQLKLKLL